MRDMDEWTSEIGSRRGKKFLESFDRGQGGMGGLIGAAVVVVAPAVVVESRIAR